MTDGVRKVLGFIADAIQPKQSIRSADWIRENYRTQAGAPFNEYMVPWVTAPQGPCWAFDCIQFRNIWLQWAARMFKSSYALGMLMMQMDLQPGETMFATPDETNCKSVFHRFWQMISHCPVLADQVPIEQRQAKHEIKLSRSICYGAWPRGKSRLADKSIRIGHANEIDKWTHLQTSDEGDPLPRFMKRGAEYPDRKFIMESTPTITGRSRIEGGRLKSTNHRYHVPCPHCCKFQTIEFGQIKWETKKDGLKVNLTHARQTAHYICIHCGERIDDMHRPKMIRLGVWVPAGCGVDHDRAMIARDLPPDDMSWLTGQPLMWDKDYGSQLSVFYALFHGWGDMAQDFLQKQSNVAELRQWINEDKGETWEYRSKASEPETVGQRLAIDTPRGVVPEGGLFLTVTIDRQAADGGFSVYVVLAHGYDERAWLVDWGMVLTLDELWEPVVRKHYPHADGGTGLQPVACGVDSGWDTKNTYDFCRRHPGVVPIKGSSNDMHGKAYRLSPIDDKQHAEPLSLFWVNTDYWETDLQDRLDNDDRLPGRPGSLGIAREGETDIEFLTQLCNGAIEEKTDSRGNVKLIWVKKMPAFPNDMRDGVRYGLCLAKAWLDDNSGVYPARAAKNAPTDSIVYHGDTRPDGRPHND